MGDRQLSKEAAWLETVIKDFIELSKENTLQNQVNEKAFESALVGFSGGDDPIFAAYKEHVGPFHWTPLEIFNLTFPGLQVNAVELTVISWVLPMTEATKADNRIETTYPSERWARARTYGEPVNAKLRKHVAAALQIEGYKAVAPVLSPEWSRQTSQKYGFASTWSERHAAYASGLGTFGLSDGLITPWGKAMRVGSVVAQIQIPPTSRPYRDHQAYCLFFTQGICGKCIQRCPAGAITEAGHDKVTCKKYLRKSAGDYIKTHYGFEGKGCGLCQTAVPCESKIPSQQDVDALEPQ
ncbi:epoxyqueuosine reductase [Thermodesulfobacteriota bacterium]